MKWILATSLFFVCNWILAAYPAGTRIVVVKPDSQTETFSADEYDIVAKGTPVEECAPTPIEPLRPLEAPIAPPSKPEKKNRFVLYGGVNQNGYRVRTSSDRVKVFQKPIPLSGLAYSRKVWDDWSLHTAFLYQNIYLVGMGYDF